MWNHYNPTFVCAGTDRHYFKSDVRALTDNDRLRLAPCPTCGQPLGVASVIDSLIANTQDVEPARVDGLVLEYEDPHTANQRSWDEFTSRLAPPR